MNTQNPHASRQRFAACVLAALLLGGTAAAEAGAMSYTGEFQTDDQQEVFSFSLASAGSVLLDTWSYGGGTNATGQTIEAGGFAPVLSLFDGQGELLNLAASGDGSCIGHADPASGNCWDVSISTLLAAGHYFAVLTEADNLPLGNLFTDGFSRTGQGNFTGPAFLGLPASFIDPAGNERNRLWAVDVVTPTRTGAVPVPGTLCLFMAGLIGWRYSARSTGY